MCVIMIYMFVAMRLTEYRTGCVCVCFRHWLMADSDQECQLWCDRVNVVLHDLRAWHPYAVPTVRHAPKLAQPKQHR